MTQLWRVDPELAIQLDEIDDDERLPLEPTRSGHWTVAMQTTDGRKCHLASRYDPVKEAKKRIDAVPLEDKFCFFIGGFGLGYDIAALHVRLKGDAVIVVSEPSLPLLATALCCVDLTKAIASRRLVILTSEDKGRLHTRMQPHNALMMLGAQFLLHPPSQQISGEFHSRVRELLTDFVTYVRMSLVTLVSNSKITGRNVANNLATYLCTPPISIFQQAFQGRPAIIVSAGPSLRKNIHLLPQAKGRAVICAVQTVLKPLLQHGIRPDFVTSLDYHEISKRYFEDIGDLSDVHLIAEPKATWHVVDAYPGPVSLLDNDFAHLLVGKQLAGRAGLPAGATVAHLAFYFLRYLGCDPIIFIGQDLAYTGHVYYVPGVEMHQSWRSEINRFNTMEMREWERLVRSRSILRKIKDQTGQEIYTDELLFTYLEQFEKDLSGASMRVINATEGGAHIRGTQIMSLGEALERFCTEPLPAECFAFRRAVKWFDDSRLKPAMAKLAKRLEEVREVKSICQETINVLGELQKLTSRPERFNRRLARVDELRTRLNDSSRGYAIINTLSQLSELRRFTADRKLDISGVTGAERASRQLARDLEYVKATVEGADVAEEILSTALDRFGQVRPRGGPS
ncbi:MAG: motility associated factor glycosyltransferase family protein [Phycisphaerae bacterium]|nr:motility associated factor glycosyltransferase family protein [Phycisphaerae bacterium]